MCACIDQVAVDTAESQISNFALVGKPLVQSQHLQVAHFAHDELLPRPESQRGSPTRNQWHGLVNHVLITSDTVRLVFAHGGNPQRATKLIQPRLEMGQRLVV